MHAPRVTVQDVRTLLNSPAESPVLYIKEEPDTEGGELELDVWAEALVPHSAIVARREEVLDWVGGACPARVDIAHVLPDLQEDVDAVAAKLTDDGCST